MPTRSHSLKQFALSLLFAAGLVVPSLKATPVTVQELGIGANKVVTISSSSVSPSINITPTNVYAGVVKLKVDGVAMDGFCIDPWHWSVANALTYEMVDLGDAPKPPGPMGDDTALKISQLWQQYYSPVISNEQAAGLQIAIWKLVDAAINGATFTLNSANDYGASNMIAWVNANPNATAADLVGLSGSGQDFVVRRVPDGGLTVAFLGLTLLGLGAVRRKFIRA
jgi:hypothetical protein